MAVLAQLLVAAPFALKLGEPSVVGVEHTRKPAARRVLRPPAVLVDRHHFEAEQHRRHGLMRAARPNKRIVLAGSHVPGAARST
jgi:hypothetical protein